jgi:cell division protein FtsB
MKPLARIRRFPRPEDARRVMVDHAPQAEAFAASWIEHARPFSSSIYALRRRVATVAVALLAASLFVHVVFGANGMVVYKQKRAEYQALSNQNVQMQEENDRYTRQIQGLKGDQKAIEKEAREQLGYAKPGEYVYVPATQAKPVPPANHTARK